MESSTINAQRRTEFGTKHTRRLREEDRLPAVIYGHGEPPECVSLPTHDVLVELGHGLRVLTLDLDGTQKPYLIKEIQYDYLGTHPVHVDLMRVDVNERVQVAVEIEFKGTAEGTKEGGVLDQLLSELEVECLINEIPETIPAIVTHLGVGDALLVRDLKIPEGVKVLTDPDERVAAVSMVAEEVEPEEVSEEGAEPELIGRAKPEEEESES